MRLRLSNRFAHVTLFGNGFFAQSEREKVSQDRLHARDSMAKLMGF
jgi:hypothetical protein